MPSGHYERRPARHVGEVLGGFTVVSVAPRTLPGERYLRFTVACNGCGRQRQTWTNCTGGIRKTKRCQVCHNALRAEEALRRKAKGKDALRRKAKGKESYAALIAKKKVEAQRDLDSWDNVPRAGLDQIAYNLLGFDAYLAAVEIADKRWEEEQARKAEAAARRRARASARRKKRRSA